MEHDSHDQLSLIRCLARYAQTGTPTVLVLDAAGMSDEPINHKEVMETGERVAEIFKKLLRKIIPRLN